MTERCRVVSSPDFSQSPVLIASGLTFGYTTTPLLANFSARIPPGITLITGGDGCGKTTLLHLLAGQRALQAGSLHINACSLQDQPQAYASQVFWVDPRDQALNKFEALTPLDYFALQRTRYPGFDDTLLASTTEGLGLTPHLAKPLYMLSTGSKRKVWLAAAFAANTAVTLLDEPFAALDQPSIACITALLQTAAFDAARVWVLADYVAPADVPLAGCIELA